MINDSPAPDEPIATSTAGAAQLIPEDSTPEPTSASVVETGGDSQAQAPNPAATRPPAQETPEQGAAEEETPPAEEPAEDAAFAPDDTARINDDGVNMRAQPTTGDEGTVVASLAADTVVSIQDGPQEADGFLWWEIIVEDTGETGWVVEDYLEPVE